MSALRLFAIVVVVSVFGLFAGACGTEVDQQSGSLRDQSASTEQSADNTCRAGEVIRSGDSCLHEYSYQTGTTISDDNVETIVEQESILFRVIDGIGYYGDDLSGTSIESTISIAGELIAFVAVQQDDESFLIVEATQTDDLARPSATESASVCALGQTLASGDSCDLSGGGQLNVNEDGQACLNGSICAGNRLQISAIVVARQDNGEWVIEGLPE